MDKKQQIIIKYFREGQSQREISRSLRISRPTVKKYITEYLAESGQSGEAGELLNEGVVSAPRYDSSNRRKRKLTREICARIDAYLAQNRAKVSSGKAKQQMKATDIHEALLEAGYQIGYTTVCGYIRAQNERGREVYIRQQYGPGEAVEFDWAEVRLEIGGMEKRLMLAVFTCCYSNHRWSMLFYRQDMSSFLYSHVQYFSRVGGVAREVVYDNMRVAVRRFAQRNQDKVATDGLLKMATYYQFDYRFCNAGKGHEKGHVERSVEFVRRKAFSRIDRFDSLEGANSHLEAVCERLNGRIAAGESLSIVQRFEQGRPHLRPLPAPYQTCDLVQLKVDKYSCIQVDRNRYSVPEGYVGRWVEVKRYPLRLEVFSPENHPIATHVRTHERFQWYIRLEHYLQTLHTKPGALTRSVAWHQADPRLKTLFEVHFASQPKTFIELLLWARGQQIAIEPVLRACKDLYASAPQLPLSLDKIKLLATDQMSPALHSEQLPTPRPDPIEARAAQQLQQIQALFSSHS